jgi:hypothetical protein
VFFRVVFPCFRASFLSEKASKSRLFPDLGGLAPWLLYTSFMRHPNTTPTEDNMTKPNYSKLCWTVMALGAVIFWTHSAFIAFAR